MKYVARIELDLQLDEGAVKRGLDVLVQRPLEAPLPLFSATPLAGKRAFPCSWNRALSERSTSTSAWFAMIKVSTSQRYGVNELVVRREMP